MTLTYAEFCAGYGGLGLAVEEVFGAELKWYSEFDAAPSKVMAHHWPGVPNHGDMTSIDWSTVEAADILSGGTPCQDLSAAGRRKGMTEGTRSNLWVHMREAIAVIKPKYVVWENVRGAYSASASSDLEQCPGCVGDTSDGRVFLRALGRVLGDLSDLGYDCQWRGLRAADVGSCHGRYRVFILATHRDSAGRIKHGRAEPIRTEHAAAEHAGNDATNPECEPGRERWESAPGQTPSGQPSSVDSGRGGTLATPNPNSGDDDGRLSDTQRRQERREATPRSGEGSGAHADPESIGRGEGRTEPEGQQGGSDDAISSGTNWGEYEPAIRRHERTFSRSAPRPTEPTGRNNGHRLSPRFTEWMMGLPDGWVTAPEIGLTRNEQLKACGNGVVPQQAIAAMRDMATFRQAS